MNRMRLVTGPILVVALVLLVLLDASLCTLPGTQVQGPVIFLLLLVVCPLGAIELSWLLHDSGIPGRPWIAACGSILGGLAMTIASVCMTDPVDSTAVLGTCLALIFCLAISSALPARSVEGTMSSITSSLCTTVYIGILPAFWMLLRQEHSAWFILGLVLVIKSSDIGAFTVGMLAGRRKLIYWLSPGKTWEGFLGGVGSSALVGMIMGFWLVQDSDSPAFGPLAGLLVGAVMAIVGQAGDLIESMFKRAAGRKDSGTLLPGMGGVLDVVDSLIWTAPVAWWILRLI